MRAAPTYAFGMAPPKPDTHAVRGAAVAHLLELVEGNAEAFALPSRLEQLSTVKGLFSRAWREDQWD